MEESPKECVSMDSGYGVTDASVTPKCVAGAKRSALDRVDESAAAEAPAGDASSNALGARGEALQAKLALDQCLFECEEGKLSKRSAAKAEAAASAEGAPPTPDAPAAPKKGRRAFSGSRFEPLAEEGDAEMESEDAETAAGSAAAASSAAGSAAAAPAGGAPRVVQVQPTGVAQAATQPSSQCDREAEERAAEERMLAGVAFFWRAMDDPEGEENKQTALFLRLMGAMEEVEFKERIRPTLGLLVQCIEEQMTATRRGRPALTSVAEVAAARGRLPSSSSAAPARAAAVGEAPSPPSSAAPGTAAAALRRRAPAAASTARPAASSAGMHATAKTGRPAAATGAKPTAAAAVSSTAAAPSGAGASPGTQAAAKGAQATPSRIPGPRSAASRPLPRDLGPPPSRYIRVDNSAAHKNNPKRCPLHLMLWLLPDGSPQLRSSRGFQLSPPEGWGVWNARTEAWKGVRRPDPPSSPKPPPSSRPSAGATGSSGGAAGGPILGTRSYAAAVGGSRATSSADGAMQQRLAGLESTVSQQAENLVVQLSGLQAALRAQQEMFQQQLQQQQECMAMQLSAMQHSFAQHTQWMMGGLDARSALAPPRAGPQAG